MQHDGGDSDQAALDDLADVERIRRIVPEDLSAPMVEHGALRGIVIGAPMAALLWGIIILIGWALL